MNQYHILSRIVQTAEHQRPLVEKPYGFSIQLTRQTAHYIEHPDKLDLSKLDGVVYSEQKLPGSSKKNEYVMELDRLDDFKAYGDAYEARLAIRLCSQYNVSCRVLADEDYPAARLLHDAWLARKKADPEVFQMLLSNNYLKMLDFCHGKPGYIALGVFAGDELIAWRLLAIDGSIAFGLASIADYSKPYKYIGNVAYRATAEVLLGMGVTKINDGMIEYTKPSKRNKLNQPGYKISYYTTKVESSLKNDLSEFLS